LGRGLSPTYSQTFFAGTLVGGEEATLADETKEEVNEEAAGEAKNQDQEDKRQED
jgi:hypothetical protein